MIRRILTTAGAAVILIAITTSPGVADGGDESVDQVDSYEDATPSVASSDEAEVATYLDEDGEEIADPANPDNSSEEVSPSEGFGIAAIGCTPVSGRDNPHFSGGDVSGHGWWGKGSCSKPTARVQNCLYEFYTDRSWRLKKCGAAKTLKPGTGGSANRTNARVKCGTQTLTSWRNHVEVDVIGQVDSGEKPFTEKKVGCRVK